MTSYNLAQRDICNICGWCTVSHCFIYSSPSSFSVSFFGYRETTNKSASIWEIPKTFDGSLSIHCSSWVIIFFPFYVWFLHSSFGTRRIRFKPNKVSYSKVSNDWNSPTLSSRTLPQFIFFKNAGINSPSSCFTVFFLLLII